MHALNKKKVNQGENQGEKVNQVQQPVMIQAMQKINFFML